MFEKRLLKYATVCCFIMIVSPACTKKLPIVSISISTQQDTGLVPLNVEVASTPAQQQQGLMHRKHIPDNTGMIFVYDKDSKLSFWMKNTPHPLSIAFIDSRGRIREIRHMQPFSLETTVSTYSVRYALEVPHGYFTRAGITAGDSLTPESLLLLRTHCHQNNTEDG